MALPREVSDDLFVLCDTLIEGGEEGVESTISGLTREQFGVHFNLRGEGLQVVTDSRRSRVPDASLAA